MRIDRHFLQTLLNRLQITQRIAQTLKAVAGDKAAIHQPRHLRLHVRQPQGHGHIHPTLQALVDIEHGGKDLLDLFGNLHHGVVQLRAHLFMKLSKALFRPDRTARLVDQLIHTAGDAVVDQIQHLTVRVKVEPQLGFVRQLLVQILNRRRDVKQKQSTQPAPHHLLLFLRIVKELNRHAVALINQRGPGFDLIVPALLLIAFRKLTKAPDVQPALLDTVVRHGRQGFLHFALQGVLQFRKRAAFQQLFVFIVHHAEGDFQVIGHLIPVPVVAVDGGPGHASELTLQRVQQRQLQRRDAAQKRFGVVRRRHKVTPHRFRQGFD